MRQEQQLRPPESGEVDWCRSRLRSWVGRECVISDVTAIPHRASEGYRLTVRVDQTTHTFYLKRYTRAPRPQELEEQFHLLSSIASTFGDTDGLAPYRVVASDLERRLLLTAETPGTPLAAFHRALIRSGGLRSALALRAWHGVGTWLRQLHRCVQPPARSTDRPAQLVAYTVRRLRKWADLDPRQRGLAGVAEIALERALETIDGRAVQIVPCHGDVSVSNIIVADTVGLIDFDDVRLDLPAVDLSQAFLELEEFGRAVSTVPLPRVAAEGRAAFLAGYGESRTSGPEFWLPHLRNLAVFLLTLATRRAGFNAARLTNEARYRRTIAELRRSVDRMVQSDCAADYFPRA